MIVALAGGVGGAKLAVGLAEVLPPDALMIAVNTGDDFVHLGVHICPDLDTVMYTLAGINDPVQGWGIVDETWNFMQALERLGGDTWFRLGDRDLATHIERTSRLSAGHSLTVITEQLCARLGVAHHVVPMSDDPVRTIVHTTGGALAFQDYFVRLRAEPAVAHIEYRGADQAKLSPALHAALASPALEGIVVCPSNPYLSIAPILAVPGMRSALEGRRVPVIAVSPIVAGRALKGPAAKMMRELGEEPSSLTVARFYRGVIDALVMDNSDESLVVPIRALGQRAVLTQTVMRDRDSRIALAGVVVEQVRGAHRLTQAGV
jgi:LPPG:FO 2-phospho-L-lactate transferase